MQSGTSRSTTSSPKRSSGAATSLGATGWSLPPAATTVRVRKGKVSTTDGPFAETKEQLGGYYVIEAKDLNEAIQVAARIPGARIGCVEVRPIAEDARTLRVLGLVAPDSPR